MLLTPGSPTLLMAFTYDAILSPLEPDRCGLAAFEGYE